MCPRFSYIKITRFYVFARGGSVRRRFPSAEYLTPLTPEYIPLPSLPPFYVFHLLSSSSYQNVREFSVFISLSFPFCSSPLPLLPLRFSSNFPLPFRVALFSPSSLRRPPSRAVNYKVLARIIVHATTFTFARGILSIFFGQIEGRQCRGMHTPLSPQSALRAAFSALRGNPIGGIGVSGKKSRTPPLVLPFT